MSFNGSKSIYQLDSTTSHTQCEKGNLLFEFVEMHTVISKSFYLQRRQITTEENFTGKPGFKLC